LNSERARQIAQHQLTTQTLVNLEREHQLDRLKSIIEALTVLAKQLSLGACDEIAIYDTNALLRGTPMDQQAWFDLFPSCLESGHVRIVIAHIQLDELDKLSHAKPTSDLARTAIRLVDRLREPAKHPEEPVEVADRITMQILADPPLHIRLESNDAEFMSRAQLVHAISGRPPTILTIDRGMIVRSHVHGISYRRVS
jgi:PIN domain